MCTHQRATFFLLCTKHLSPVPREYFTPCHAVNPLLFLARFFFYYNFNILLAGIGVSLVLMMVAQQIKEKFRGTW